VKNEDIGLESRVRPIQRGPKSKASAHFCFYLWKASIKYDNFFGTRKRHSLLCSKLYV